MKYLSAMSISGLDYICTSLEI